MSSPIPGMPTAKSAGVRCVQLDADNACAIVGRPERPTVCASLNPSPEMCGSSPESAKAMLTSCEYVTAPDSIFLAFGAHNRR